MIKLAIVSLSVATLAAALVGCDDPNELTGRQNVPKPGEEGSLTPEALQCTDKPEGRSYVLFDGTKLEQERRNENVGINRARFKPFAVLAGEYQRVLGAVPPSLEGSGASFDDPPARWYAEANHSGVSLNAMFDISFEGCAESVKKQAESGAGSRRSVGADVLHDADPQGVEPLGDPGGDRRMRRARHEEAR